MTSDYTWVCQCPESFTALILALAFNKYDWIFLWDLKSILRCERISWCARMFYATLIIKGLYRRPLEEQSVQWACKLFACAQWLWAYLWLSVPNELILLDLSLFTFIACKCTDVYSAISVYLLACILYTVHTHTCKTLLVGSTSSVVLLNRGEACLMRLPS